MRLRLGIPVLYLGDGLVQIGLRDPIVLRGVSDTEARFLASLEGRTTSVSEGERQQFEGMVVELERHPRLLGPEDSARGRLAQVVVRWRGCGRPAVYAARVLALAGVRTMSAIDPRIVSPADPHPASDSGLTRAEALARSVGETGVEVRWISGESTADIEILSSHGAPDVVATRDLLSRDIPHLLIVSDEDGVSVGPVVLPGSTACATCLALTRAERDPHWPRVVLQLGSPARDGAAHLSAECSALAGAVAARELLATLRGARSEAGQWWVASRGDLAWAPVLPHRDCGCGAACDVGDAAAAKVARMPRAGASSPQPRLGSAATISRISTP
jgi:hypothetical protein